MKIDSTNENISYIVFDKHAPSINLICKNSASANTLYTQIEGGLKRTAYNKLREGRGDGVLRINIANKESCIIMSGILLSIKDCLFSNKLISTESYFELGKEIAAFNDEHFDWDTDSDEEDTSIENIPHSPTFFKTPTTCREDASKSPSPDVGKENTQLPPTKTK